MDKFIGYTCSICQHDYAPDEVTYTCPKDGGNLDVILDYDAIRKKYQPEDLLSRANPSIWRYLPLLPVSAPSGDATPLHLVGGTPIYSLTHTAEKLGLKQLWLKDESRNPTASFKDRASAIVVTRAREIKAEVVVTASTGNAGAALAGMAAAVGQKAVIFAPRSAPQAKIAQLLVFGARVILVDGSYDDAFDLTVKAAQEFGWYCRNTGYNPFTAEGKKTAAFEIWEFMRNQMGTGMRASSNSITIPVNEQRLAIFVSVGDGNIISGLHKGFKDLHTLGWLGRMPRIIGVQAEGSAAIANTFHDFIKSGSEIIHPVQAKTIADSISVDLPRDGLRALRAASETGGTYITVSDQKIISAISDLGQIGVFAEPAGAAAFAGLIEAKNQGWLEADSPVLVINTGSGLKDIRAALQAVQPAPIIEPTLDALKRIFP